MSSADHSNFKTPYRLYWQLLSTAGIILSMHVPRTVLKCIGMFRKKNNPDLFEVALTLIDQLERHKLLHEYTAYRPIECCISKPNALGLSEP